MRHSPPFLRLSVQESNKGQELEVILLESSNLSVQLKRKKARQEEQRGREKKSIEKPQERHNSGTLQRVASPHCNVKDSKIQHTPASATLVGNEPNQTKPNQGSDR